jgi:hypothetical protein
MLAHRFALPLFVVAWLLVSHFMETHVPAMFASLASEAPTWPEAAPPASAHEDLSHRAESAGQAQPASEASPACVDKRPWPTAFGFAWTDGPGTSCAAPK